MLVFLVNYYLLLVHYRHRLAANISDISEVSRSPPEQHRSSILAVLDYVDHHPRRHTIAAAAAVNVPTQQTVEVMTQLILSLLPLHTPVHASAKCRINELSKQPAKDRADDYTVTADRRPLMIRAFCCSLILHFADVSCSMKIVLFAANNRKKPTLTRVQRRTPAMVM